MGVKRGSSPLDASRARADDKKHKLPKRDSFVRKISNGDAGKIERSDEALSSLNTKKTKEEIWADVEPFKRKTTNADFDAKTMYKLITWNVAGLRGMLKKDPNALKDFLVAEQPDILCLQETKLNVDDATANEKLGVVDGYMFVDHPCTFKKGYSGTRTYMRTDSVINASSVRCTRGFALPTDSAFVEAGVPPIVEGAGDEEGRVLTTFLTVPKHISPTLSVSGVYAAPRLAIVNTYVPNSGMGLDRLPYRIKTFDPLMCEYLTKLDAWCKGKATPVEEKSAGADSADAPPPGFIWTGDLNVAERDFDRYYAGTFKSMQECSGFTPEERSSFRHTVAAANAVDVFRYLYPNAGPAYTFWSARINGRAKGLGWRIDYFVVSSRLVPYVVDCFPMPEIAKSDHCPLQLWLRKP